MGVGRASAQVEAPELGLVDCRPRLRYHKGNRDGALHRVRDVDHTDIDNGRVLQEDIFDFLRVDALAPLS